MNRFAYPLRLDLTACPADFLVLSVFTALALLAAFCAEQTLAAALLPLIVAQVVVSWSRLAEPRWTALKSDPGAGWQALAAYGRWEPVTVSSNFQCSAVVLVSISRSRARQHRALWRHHQPDGFRHLLGSLGESRDA